MPEALENFLLHLIGAAFLVYGILLVAAVVLAVAD